METRMAGMEATMRKLTEMMGKLLDKTPTRFSNFGNTFTTFKSIY